MFFRDPKQYFVFFSIENPAYFPQLSPNRVEKFVGGFINWTMTYRRDADVYYPYARLDKRILSSGKSYIDALIKSKSNLAVSFCLNFFFHSLQFFTSSRRDCANNGFLRCRCSSIIALLMLTYAFIKGVPTFCIQIDSFQIMNRAWSVSNWRSECTQYKMKKWFLAMLQIN